MTVVLETARLRLREMEPSDLDFVAAMLADKEVVHYYERSFSRADAQAWLDRQRQRYADDGHGLWLMLSTKPTTIDAARRLKPTTSGFGDRPKDLRISRKSAIDGASLVS